MYAIRSYYVFDRERVVDQLHFGGGTPTFLNPWQLEDLLKKLDWHFNLRKDSRREFSIEIDPRTCEPDTIDLLARAGVNRITSYNVCYTKLLRTGLCNRSGTCRRGRS